MTCSRQHRRHLVHGTQQPTQLKHKHTQIIYQNLQSRFGIERHPYTKSRIDQIPCVCMCNYSQTTEQICIRIIPPNRASYADCYRLLRFEIFTRTIFKTPKTISGGPVMINQWEIEDSCNAHKNQ